jgi:hypothetical protein
MAEFTKSTLKKNLLFISDKCQLINDFVYKQYFVFNPPRDPPKQKLPVPNWRENSNCWLAIPLIIQQQKVLTNYLIILNQQWFF